MQVLPQRLFVYGTLLKDAENMMSGYLKTKTRYLGEAEMPGKLFKVDFFPGAVYDVAMEDRVLGELYEIQDPPRLFEVLDTYEGYDPEQPENGLFLRDEVSVLHEGEWQRSWAYLYNLPIGDLPEIPDGDFLKFDMESHASH